MLKHKRLWCYLNIDNPIVAWEVAVGRISSIDSSVDIEDKYRRSFLSFWQYSKLKHAQNYDNWDLFEQEMKIELVRHVKFPEKVSRLRGCYFFESEEMALNVVKYFNWRGFKKEHLSEISFLYSSDSDISEHDSAWITNDMSDDDIHSYLSGQTKYESPATELLCYGRGLILNQDLINKADEIARKTFPKSTVLLDTVKLIFNDRFLGRNYATGEFDWDAYHAAQISPYLLIDGDDNLKVTILGSQKAYEKYGVIPTKEEVFLPDLRSHMINIKSVDIVTAYARAQII
ncbi:hypothetical protein [Vibrio algarum]|uniref:DUF2971 domain-containing protein n=1 Tax=Vibrio algarum TaxID=3020714 RepID=A0ABT4YRU3_9VIBR|nr:hypothetical protein [Vibrio sp. KJ40-1]MDB1124261.1 hypothetical protein [Vibrio sp. KJ40-1]